MFWKRKALITRKKIRSRCSEFCTHPKIAGSRKLHQAFKLATPRRRGKVALSTRETFPRPMSWLRLPCCTNIHTRALFLYKTRVARTALTAIFEFSKFLFFFWVSVMLEKKDFLKNVYFVKNFKSSVLWTSFLKIVQCYKLHDVKKIVLSHFVLNLLILILTKYLI